MGGGEFYARTLWGVSFDDIMYLEAAQREHDQFSEVLRKAGVKVHYLEDLVAQSMEHQPDAAKAMVEQYLLESGVFHPQMRQELLQWLYESKDMATLVRTLIAGCVVMRRQLVGRRAYRV